MENLDSFISLSGSDYNQNVLNTFGNQTCQRLFKMVKDQATEENLLDAQM